MILKECLGTPYRLPHGKPRRKEEAASILILTEILPYDSLGSPPNKGDLNHELMPVPKEFMCLEPFILSKCHTL